MVAGLACPRRRDNNLARRRGDEATAARGVSFRQGAPLTNQRSGMKTSVKIRHSKNKLDKGVFYRVYVRSTRTRTQHFSTILEQFSMVKRKMFCIFIRAGWHLILGSRSDKYEVGDRNDGPSRRYAKVPIRQSIFLVGSFSNEINFVWWRKLQPGPYNSRSISLHAYQYTFKGSVISVVYAIIIKEQLYGISREGN